MPNICENTIEIRGSVEAIDKLIEKCTTQGFEGRFNVEDELVKVLDLGLAYPQPEEFDFISTGGGTINGEKVNVWRTKDTQTGEYVKLSMDIMTDTTDRYERVALADNEVKLFMELYGATNWYDWRYENWGTKWVTQVDIDNIEQDTYGDNTKAIFFTVDSAWGPPMELLETICNNYKVDIHNRWWEEGGEAGWEHLTGYMEDKD